MQIQKEQEMNRPRDESAKWPPRILASISAMWNLRRGERPLMWPIEKTNGVACKGEEIYLPFAEHEHLLEAARREARSAALKDAQRAIAEREPYPSEEEERVAELAIKAIRVLIDNDIYDAAREGSGGKNEG